MRQYSIVYTISVSVRHREPVKSARVKSAGGLRIQFHTFTEWKCNPQAQIPTSGTNTDFTDSKMHLLRLYCKKLECTVLAECYSEKSFGSPRREIVRLEA